MTEPNWKYATKKLHRLLINLRWALVLLSWLTLGIYGLWQLREDYALWRDYFTWVAVRYALVFNPQAAFCLFTCLGLTSIFLVRQLYQFIFGVSNYEQNRLLKRARIIYHTGANHPFYNYLYSDKDC